jgi:hypothetical protein
VNHLIPGKKWGVDMRQFTIILTAFLVLPLTALADASVVQDYCEQLVEGSYDELIIHFSVVNYSLPAPICDLHLVYEPIPPDSQCQITALEPPPGWSGYMSPLGVDFFANTPSDCIDAGTMMGGFQIVVGNPEFCCFIVQFTDPTGAVIEEQEECFNCTLVGENEHAWGEIKSMYR